MIADFQGRELDDEKVIAEYKEIRDAVLLDVRLDFSRKDWADLAEGSG